MSVSVTSHVQSIGMTQKKIIQIVERTLQQTKQHGDVSVHLIADTRMRRLNREYRGKDKTTDVLSFAAQEGFFNHAQESDFGDIFISVPQIKRQAKRFVVSYQEEFSRMLIHGTLHLLGYDHLKKKDADVMFPLQEKILKHL